MYDIDLFDSDAILVEGLHGQEESPAHGAFFARGFGSLPRASEAFLPTSPNVVPPALQQHRAS